MNRRVALLLPVMALLAACVATVGVWLRASRVEGIEPRLPSGEPELNAEVPLSENVQGILISGAGKPSAYPGEWPQFLGERRDNIARPDPPLAASWTAQSPRVLWKVHLGEGYAGPAVRGGRVFLVDYDEAHLSDAIRCLSLDDGAEIWRYSYPVKIKRNHGISRTVPAVTDRYVVSIGPLCHVTCLEMETGAPVWKMDMVREFGTEVPPWYTGQCPLVDGDAVILAPGATPLMMAVELATGKVRWQTENPCCWHMTHSSVAKSDVPVRQYIYCTTMGVVGVSADDGRLLWKKKDWKIAIANVPTPVPIGDGRVLLTGGYNAGAAMIRLPSGEGEPDELFRLPASVFGSDQQTPIFSKGFVYGVIPGGELACLDLSGAVRWTSGPSARFGLGPILLAGDFILALNDQTGTLVMADASPDGYRERGRFKALDGHDAWAPMALVGHRLLLRDSKTLVCLELP